MGLGKITIGMEEPTLKEKSSSGSTMLQAAPVPHALMLDRAFSHAGYRAYTLLIAYAHTYGISKGINTATGIYYIYPGQSRMAQDWGVSERTVKRAMSYLRGQHSSGCSAVQGADCSCGEAYHYPLIEMKQPQGSGAALGQTRLIKFLELPAKELSNSSGTIVFEAGEYQGYSLIPSFVAFHPELSNLDVRVWADILRLSGGCGTAYPSEGRIGYDLGVHRDTVAASIASLRRAAVLSYITRGLQQTHLYVFPNTQHLGSCEWAETVAGLPYHRLVKSGHIAANGKGLLMVIEQVLQNKTRTPHQVGTELPHQKMPAEQGVTPLPHQQGSAMPPQAVPTLPEPESAVTLLPHQEMPDNPQLDVPTVPPPSANESEFPHQEGSAGQHKYDSIRSDSLVAHNNSDDWLEQLADNISSAFGDEPNRSSNRTRLVDIYQQYKSQVDATGIASIVQHAIAATKKRTNVSRPVAYVFSTISRQLIYATSPDATIQAKAKAPAKRKTGLRNSTLPASEQPTAASSPYVQDEVEIPPELQPKPLHKQIWQAIVAERQRVWPLPAATWLCSCRLLAVEGTHFLATTPASGLAERYIARYHDELAACLSELMNTGQSYSLTIASL